MIIIDPNDKTDMICIVGQLTRSTVASMDQFLHGWGPGCISMIEDDEDDEDA